MGMFCFFLSCLVYSLCCLNSYGHTRWIGFETRIHVVASSLGIFMGFLAMVDYVSLGCVVSYYSGGLCFSLLLMFYFVCLTRR